MKRLIVLCAIALSLGSFSVTYAADRYYLGDLRLAVIDDPVRVDFQNHPAELTQQKIQQIIAVIGASKEWKVASESAGRTELTALKNGKHMIRIEVTYDLNGFSIRYLESADLLYREPKQGGGTLRAIHRNYNKWIQELAAAISTTIGVQAQTSVGFAPLGNADAVPYISVEGRKAYKEFLSQRIPRAFAIAPNGSYGAAYIDPYFTIRQKNEFDPIDAAMEHCNQRGNGECKLYILDDHVVWIRK